MAQTLQDADFALKQADAAWTLARSRVANAEARIARRSGSYDTTTAAGREVIARDQALLDQAKQEAVVAQAAYEAALANYKAVYAAGDNPTPASPPATVSIPATTPVTPSQSISADETQSPSPTLATAEAAGPQATTFAPEIIDPNSDPNTNIGTDAQAVTGFEPLQEPPSTADEFDGIDQQVADNENSLQEPPQLSDEEVDAYLQQGGEPETITSPDSITENVFDPRQEVTENVFDPTQEVTESVFDPTAGGATGSSKGLGGATNEARSTATAQDTANFETKQDWRVRLSLAPSATYLYKAENPGILKPLKDTDGVIFPYLPTVNVSYIANYDPQELTHSNYKAYQYRSSSVEQVQISGDFTAQDTNEANYMLAVIHFFRSVTKMFYGQDQNPKPGTPPPLVFLFGLGDFQFNAHPLVVTNFNYSLPNDVDYIRASAPTLGAGVSTAGYTTASNSTSPTNTRMNSSGLNTGATVAPPQFQTDSNTQPTYVPTKMQIQITALPMVTRNDISNNFSLKQYATGALLRGSQNKRAGIW